MMSEDFIAFLRQQHADVGVTPALQEAYNAYRAAIAPAQTMDGMMLRALRASIKLAPAQTTDRYSTEQKEALLSLSYRVLDGSWDFTSDHARVVLAILADLGRDAKPDAQTTGELVPVLYRWSTTEPKEAGWQFVNGAERGWQDPLVRLSDAAAAIERLTTERDIAVEGRKAATDVMDHLALAIIRADTAERQIEKLTAERNDWRRLTGETQIDLRVLVEEFGVRGGEPRMDGVRRILTELKARAETAERQVADMAAALKPFARYLNEGGAGWVCVTVADFRRARAALEVRQ